MQNSIGRVFHELDRSGPPPRLLDAVLERIDRAERRSLLLLRLPALGLGLCLSAAGTVYAVQTAAADAVSTGLTNFLSAMLTDSGTVLSSWQTYALTVIDALPIVPLAGVCAALFVFFFLLGRVDRTVAAMTRLSHHHI